MTRLHAIRASVLLAAAATFLPVLSSAQQPPAPSPAATRPAQQTEVPVKRVILFSSGVGYFEHIGEVEGDASAELRFKTQQINDILKSLVLQDEGPGRVSSVIYPSQEPIARLLRSFQVDITSNPSLAELLNQLRGAKVTITAGLEKISGTILGIEKKPKAVENGHIEIWQLNLISGGTIRSIALDEVSRLELEDDQLQEELNKALEALAKARDQDKKPVTIRFEGEGRRLVRVGYVVETPIWKTSYRLLLGGERPMLQGWAIVENQTDNDWADVRLSLVSGRPISFIQELYQPLYIPRPMVQPELYASLRPQTYEAGISRDREELAAAAEGALTSLRAAPAAPAEARNRGLGGGFGGAAPARAGQVLDEAMQKAIDPAASVESVASAARVGELFQYEVHDLISLPRQRSAMIPIITDPLEVEKLSIYNVAVLARHPLNGARIKNTTEKHLLHGPVTVLDGNTYAGDARIDNVPPGQERLISYGVDLEMVVNATKNRQESVIQSGSIVKGVLHLRRRHVFSQEYVAENKSAEAAKKLIIEHPFRRGWTLANTPKPIETTEQLYRFRVEVAPDKTESFTVTEQVVQPETIAILPADIGMLLAYSRSGEIPKDVRDALARAAALKQAVVDAERQMKQTQAEIEQVTRAEERIRENIKATPERSALQNRMLERLSEHEDQIDGLSKKLEEQQTALEQARKELEAYVSSLNVG